MKIKNQWMRKGICLMLALVLALGCFFTDAGWQIAKAAGEYQQEDEVLFESNYDGVTHYENCPDGQVVNNTDWYRPLAGQLFTQKVGDNGYLQYTQSSDTLGVIRLGHTYEQKNVNYTPITVTAGTTYLIEFDMSVNAAQWILKNNLTDSRQWPARDLLMGVAVGPETTSLNTSYANYKNTYTADLQVFETLDANSKVVSTAWEGNENGWVHRKWVYTVPEDCDLSANNALQIFFADGQRCAVSIDNVKVTIPAGITVTYDIEGTKTEVFYADGNIPTDLPEGIAKDTSDGKVLRLYEDAEYTTAFSAASYERTGRYTTKTIYGRYEDFRYDEDTVLFESNYEDALATDSTVAFEAVSNQLYPKKEGENKYLYYAQSNNTIGILRLGHSYKNKSLTEYAPVTVVPGQTYLIEFDYRLKTYLNEEQQQQFPWPASNMTLGVAVGDARADVTELNHVTYFNYTSYHEDEVIAVKESKPDVEWTHKTISVTIPKDCDTSKYNALQLYATLGQRCGLHIDNVKVTATAGVTVNYKVGDQTVSAYYSDGKIPSTLPEGLEELDASGNVLALYTDAAYTTKFVAEEYVRTGSYTTVTLYGRYEAFKYETDTILADNSFDTALIQENPPHKNSGDLFPVKDPKNESDTVLRYRQSWYGLGVAQLGYDYTDVNGKDNLTDYVRVRKGITYKITFDYLVQGTAQGNLCQVGVAIGAPIYKYGDIGQGNYLTEGVTWYRELMSFGIGETVDTGWQTKTVFITVDKDIDLSTFDALQLYAKGGRNGISVYFDNIKVVGLKDRSYTVKFNVNGGNAIADRTVNLAELNNLPQATRSNAVFMGWYTDAALTVPFKLDTYVDTTKPIILYAKWHVFTNGAVNTLDDLSFWKNPNGTYSDGRLGAAFSPVVENGNQMMKYSVGYAASRAEEVSERGVKCTSSSAVYPARMTLYNPDLTVTGNYDYLDVAYRAQIGKTYKVSFSYKVTDVDMTSSDKGLAFSVLTGNINNSHDEWIIHASRFVIETASTGWKTATTYVTINSLGNDKVYSNGKSYYSNAIMLGVGGYGTAFIDNVSVTDWDIEAPTYVTFSTKGGEKLPSQEYVINGSTVLPKAVRAGYTFDGWYLDAKCTKKFNPATYKRTNGVLTLYAGYKGMQGVTEIDFEEISYLKDGSGNLHGARIADQYNVYTENGNTALRYKLRYSDKKQTEPNRDDSYGNYGTYGQAIGLFDPAVCMSPNWTLEDATLRVEEGQKYWVSFQYKVNAVDTESTYPAAILFAVGTTKDTSVYDGRQYFGRPFNPVDEPTNGWVTASTYFTVPKLTEGGSRMTLFTLGYGDILIDNIKVIQLSDAVIFDTDGGTVVEPFRGNVGQTVELPTNLERTNSKFMGWCTDANCTQAYSAGKMESGVKVLYAKYLTYQSIQDFEHFNVGMGESFETDYFLNKHTFDTEQTAYHKWLGSAYEEENVRNGKVSVQRLGDNQYSRLLGLFYMNTPLTVGEEYEMSVWVKMTDYFLPGDIQLVYSDVKDNFRSADYWSESQRGARFENIVNTESMKDYVGEWVELKYTFTAKSKYVGLSMPGITRLYIDDACITLTSADESYVRSIDGDGLKYEEWYKEKTKGSKDEEEETVEPVKEVKRGFSVWAIVAIVCGVVVLAGGLVTAVILLKKKKKHGAISEEPETAETDLKGEE